MATKFRKAMIAVASGLALSAWSDKVSAESLLKSGEIKIIYDKAEDYNPEDRKMIIGSMAAIGLFLLGAVATTKKKDEKTETQKN